MRGLTNFQEASFALGQIDLQSGEPNQGQTTAAHTLDNPHGLAVTAEGALLLADTGNNRVLFFPTMPTGFGASASLAFGQPGLQGSGASLSAEGLTRPRAVAYAAGKVVIADSGANRVLIYDQIPVGGTGPGAVVVIGQGGFGTNEPRCGELGLNAPSAVAITPEGKLLVADRSNSRILVWDRIPDNQEQVTGPSLVLGQFDADHCEPNDDDHDGQEDRDLQGLTAPTAKTLYGPNDIWTDGRRLVVADTQNHRVLIWEDFPTETFQEADFVLGHDTFTNALRNSENEADGELGHPTARTLVDPTGVHSDGTSLVVVDGNHRVLVWNTFPLQNLKGADVVIGQSDFDQNADPDGADTPATSRAVLFPSKALLVRDFLLVSDAGHNRVLVFRR